MSNKINIFMDSGAFSVASRGLEISIYDYIDYIRKYKPFIYSSLDVIFNGEKTFQNWKIMKEEGLDPLPVFHLGSDLKFLKYYLKETDYIALGGVADISMTKRYGGFDFVWDYLLTDERGFPTHKVHAFGMTSVPMLYRYPWYSADSTKWLAEARYGRVIIPDRIRGYKRMMLIPVSSRQPTKEKKSAHITTYTGMQKEYFDSYIKSKGYKLGSVEEFSVGANYELKENEQWVDKEKGVIEKIIEKGLSNSIYLRAEINVLFFLDLLDSLPEWPWAFKHKHRNKGFDLEEEE